MSTETPTPVGYGQNVTSVGCQRVRVGQVTPSKKKADIRVQKEGDMIVAIEVICACGETIKIDCQYASQSDAA